MKEKLSNRLSPFSRLRIEVSQSQIIAISALALILFVAFVVRILPLRWENLSGGTALLNEFDPYYQFSLTQYMVTHGSLLAPYWPTQWINDKLWYPFGFNMGTESLPGTPMTGAALYMVFKTFGANIDLMTFTSLIPPFIGVVSCLVMYFIGKDYGGRAVGLFAALFLALEPSIIQRTSLGFYDTQVVGTVALILFIFLFLRSVDAKRTIRGTMFYALGAGAALAYFIAGWGGAYYVVDLVALFSVVMILLKRYSQKLLVSYSITFGLGLYLATLIPYINLSYLISYAVLPVAGVFLLLLISEVLRNNISVRSKITLTAGALVIIAGGFLGLALTGHLGSIAGKFGSILNPFLRVASPITNSVAEQQISAWGNIYIELGVGILFFIIGLYFTLRNPTNRNVFLLIFAITSLYFAGSMIRLLAIFAPAYAVIASVGILSVTKPFYTLLKESSRTLAKTKRRLPRVSKEYSGLAIFMVFIILVTLFAFAPQETGAIPRSISSAFVPTAISGGSLPLGGAGLNSPVTAWTDALSWIKTNVPYNNVVVSWWDYGFWLTYLGNCTTLNDNTTENTTQIANVGFIMMGDENESLHMLSSYDSYNNPGRVNYILVFTVLQLQANSAGTAYTAYPAGYGDEGKFVWMARISGQDESSLIQEGYMNNATAWKDETAFGNYTSNGQWQWNAQGDNCTLYELMSNAEVQYCDEMSAAYSSQGVTFTPSATATTPSYFQVADIAGLNASPGQYGGLIPLVAIYSINYTAYDVANGIIPTATP